MCRHDEGGEGFWGILVCGCLIFQEAWHVNWRKRLKYKVPKLKMLPILKILEMLMTIMRRYNINIYFND